MTEADLRVAWFADIFDEVSGVVTDTIEMYEQASAKGLFWQPITCYPKPLEPFFVFKPISSVPAGSFYKGSYLHLPNFLSIVSHLKKNKVNLIVSNTPATMGLMAMGVSSFLGLPWIDIYHTDVDFYMDKLSEGIFKAFSKFTAFTFMKMYHKSADLIFVRNQDYYELMLTKGHSRDKLCLYPPGVNQERFTPRSKDRSVWKEFGIEGEKYIILFVGRITKVKDIVFLLDAFSENDYENCELVLVGEGPEYEPYREKCAISNNIHFLGIQKHELLQKIYASSDLYVLPSASETLGKTVLEAMASGTPALVSDKGGPKDHIQDKINGRIFQAGNYQHFIEVLGDMLENPLKLKEMGKKAHESVRGLTMENLFLNFSKQIVSLLNKD